MFGLLDKGGFASVYEGYDTIAKKDIVIKKVSLAYFDTFNFSSKSTVM